MRIERFLTLMLLVSLVGGCGFGRGDAATSEATAGAVVEATIQVTAEPIGESTAEPTLEPTATTTTLAPQEQVQDTHASSNASIDEIMAGMSVEEKLGQLFMVFFDGTEFSPELERTIRELHVGGILIFHGNVGPLENLAALIAEAQAVAAESGAQIPLFVGIDHEGGWITRLGNRVTEFAGPMAVAATGDVENARAVAEVMSVELRALGINMNLAPVFDVNNNPANPVIGPRSFGSTTEIVSRFGVAMLEGFHAQGMMTTAKHFPGHGDTDIDSHSDLPVIDKPMDELQQLELVPFAAAIDAGTDLVMTAHVSVPPLTGDAELPATFSRAILHDLLREQMGFEGLVAADSLGMNALDLRYGITQTASNAVDGGVDLLMFGADPGHTPIEQFWAFDYLMARIERGELSVARIDESVRRILQTKARYGLLAPNPGLTQNPSAAQLEAQIRTEEHLAIAEQISEQAVTLVKNEGALLPLDPEQRVALVYPEFETDLPLLFADFATTLITVPTTIDPDANERTQIVKAAAQADVVVVATYYTNFYPGQAETVRALSDRPLVVIALTNPYDLLQFPEVEGYLTTYNDNASLVNAAVRMIYGEIQPRGKLPIDLPPDFPVGFGLRYGE